MPLSQQTGQHLNKEAGALPLQTTKQSLSCALGLCAQGFDGVMGKAVPVLPAHSPDSSTGPRLLSLAGLGSSSDPVGLRTERGSEGLTWVAQRVVGAHPWRHSAQPGQGSVHLWSLGKLSWPSPHLQYILTLTLASSLAKPNRSVVKQNPSGM